ncbi:MAG: SpoIIE family protein phosphatase [Bacillota bacterium]|nr:SpoIIE family protein phosphatase [Bacillota bacterium]
MLLSYIKLGIAAMLPVLLAAFITILERKEKKRLPYWAEQILIGIAFGILAIVGTEWGIPMNGAQANCRDAAPLVAGLLFGAPAGVIAGLIGGIERWVAVAWGVGSFTRVACTVSTILAGIYAAILRKTMFENKRPAWTMALASGIVIEVFHLSMVFLTRMDESVRAMAVVKACAIPMIVANGVSVMLAALLVTIISKEKLFPSREHTRVSTSLQRSMLVAVIIMVAAIGYFTYNLQDQIAADRTLELLTVGSADIQADVINASNQNLLSVSHEVCSKIGNKSLETLADEYKLAEINIINESGIIVNSNDKDLIGFDMTKYEETAEFLCLLEGTPEFVQDSRPSAYNGIDLRKYAGVIYKKGFVQIGCNLAEFQDDLTKELSDIATLRHIGEAGFAVVLDKDYNVVSAPMQHFSLDYYKILSRASHEDGSLPAPEEVFESTFKGVSYFARYVESEGHYFLSFLPQTEALTTRNIALYATSFMVIIMFGLLFAFIFYAIKGLVVDPLHKVEKSLSNISNGKLDEVVSVRGNEEFATLSDDINVTVDKLKDYIAEAAARIDKDLAMAKAIQSSALPSEFPAKKELEIYACMDTAKEVGGDFYDYYHTHKSIVTFLIADVSGKGIPAAMFMMRAKTEIKSQIEKNSSLAAAITQANNDLCEGNDNDMFVTAWQGKINLLSGTVKYANAGHNPPVIMHVNGECEYLKSKVNLVLAGMPGVKYVEQELQLTPGDVLFLYTDGITEATDANNELYGEDRLLTCLNNLNGADPKFICDKVKEDVDAFVKDAPQFDDMTMVCVRYNGIVPDPFIRFQEAKIEDIPAITEFLEEKLEAMGCPMKTVIAFNIALDELYSNIVKYAYKNVVGPAKVVVTELLDPHGVQITFVDKGVPYNPIKEEDPDTTLAAEEREIGGLGIFMVKKSMDDMSYEYKNGYNMLKITKYFEKNA